MASKKLSLVPAERIEQSILVIRGHKVMLDRDLAELYGVETRVLLQAVRRNKQRFPEDFMFQLTKEEFDNLRSQFVTSRQWGGRRYAPYVFTEQGVAMLSSVLHSEKAIQMNIRIIRAFVHLRRLIASNQAFARKLEELDQKVANHDLDIDVLDMIVTELMGPSPEHVQETEQNIGFLTSGNKNKKRRRT